MQHEKHRILAIENAEGRRRTDLRRDYNRLAAGAKAIRRSLSALNERYRRGDGRCKDVCEYV